MPLRAVSILFLAYYVCSNQSLGLQPSVLGKEKQASASLDYHSSVWDLPQFPQTTSIKHTSLRKIELLVPGLK
jgi:hypothetical protein